jgi:AcrR family transcriptional regulator
MAPATGLRERKKQQTRRRIVEHARRLFLSKGFEPTTLSDIAEGADISVSTIFGYFPTKADILFDGYDERMQDFVRHIESRPEEQSAIDATVEWHRIRGEADAQAPAAEIEWRRRLRLLIDGDPTLQTQHRERYEVAQIALAEAVAHDLSEHPNDLRPQFIAAIKVGILVAASTFSSRANLDAQDAANIQAYADACLRAAADAVLEVPTPTQHA